MSQTEAQADEQADAGNHAPSIERAGKHKWGYNISQVDEFLDNAHALYEADKPMLTQEDIQLASFDLEKNGYVISQVDAALIRLERAVVDRHTQYELSLDGDGQWTADAVALARTLQERAEAEPKERFARGLRRQPSYDMRQVDQIVLQAWTEISHLLGIRTSAEPAGGSQEITASRVSNVIFTQRKGRHGYGEASVDAYLNRCVQVLTRIESYKRVTGHDVRVDAAPAAAAAASVAPVPSAAASSKALDQDDGSAGRHPAPAPRDEHYSDISFATMALPDAGAESARPRMYSPVPRPAHEDHRSVATAAASAPAGVGQDSGLDSQTQDTGWGSKGLASLVSNRHAPEDPQHSESEPASPAETTAPVSAISPSPAAPSAPQAPAPRPTEPSDRVYTDLASVPAEGRSDPDASSSDSAASDQNYLASLMDTSVSSTGTFEIPNLTFPGSKNDADDHASQSSEHAGQHDSADPVPPADRRPRENGDQQA